MSGVVFFETWRRTWRQVGYWGIGLFIFALYGFLLIPSDLDDLQSYVDLMEAFDPAIVRALGLEDAAIFGTVEGFIGYSYFAYLLLVTAVFGVIAGLNVTANEEDSGIMDMLLSLPIPRWRVVVEKLAAYSTMIIALSVVCFVGLMVGNAITGSRADISARLFLEGSLNIVPGTLLVMALTALLGTLVRRRSTATAIAGVFVVVGYLVDAAGRAINTDASNALRDLTIFAHYEGTTVLQTGIVWGSAALLTGVALVLMVGSVVLFERRDVGV